MHDTGEVRRGLRPLSPFRAAGLLWPGPHGGEAVEGPLRWAGPPRRGSSELLLSKGDLVEQVEEAGVDHEGR